MTFYKTSFQKNIPYKYEYEKGNIYSPEKRLSIQSKQAR